MGLHITALVRSPISTARNISGGPAQDVGLIMQNEYVSGVTLAGSQFRGGRSVQRLPNVFQDPGILTDQRETSAGTSRFFATRKVSFVKKVLAPKEPSCRRGSPGKVLLRTSISESPPPRPGTVKRSFTGQSSTDVWLGARLEVLNSEHCDLVADAHERRCSK